jgi:Protein of unknown function (DUF2975)
MRTKSTLVQITYVFACLAFWVGCLSFILVLLAKSTSVNLQFGNVRFGPEPVRGYTIPVKLSVQRVPDTTIYYSKKGGGSHINIFSDEYFPPNAFADSIKKAILQDDSTKKEWVVSKWVATPGSGEPIPAGDHPLIKVWSGKDEYEILEQQIAQAPVTAHVPFINTTAEVQVEGKTKWQNFMFSLYSFISFFVYLFVSFHIMKLLQSWRRQMNFLENMHKRVNLIGRVIIYSQVIYFMLGFVYAKYFGSIILHHATAIDAADSGYDRVQVQFNPTSGGSFMIFSIGIGLIILSKLFKYGQNLEKEAALTV